MSISPHPLSPAQKLHLHLQIKVAHRKLAPLSLVSNQSAEQLALLEKNRRTAKELLLSIKTLLAQRPA